MKNMDYEKKYNEALNWMRELYPGLHGATKEDAEHYFPELAESEDERMMGVIRLALTDVPEERFTTEGTSLSEVLAWMEKQKEQKPVTINQDEKEFLADEITAFLCNYDKEFDGEDPVPSEVAEHFYLLGKQAQEQKSAEWSEEDKETIDLTIAVLKENLPNGYFKTNPANTLNMGAISTDQLINRLKSLRPQPKVKWSEEDEKMLNLAIEWAETMTGQFRFVDMDSTDFCKITTWLKSLPERFNLQPQAKQEQKPEAKLTGWVARDSKYNSYFGLGLVLFKGKPRRSGECWSGAIAAQLPWELFPDLKWEDEPLEVEIIIRKK